MHDNSQPQGPTYPDVVVQLSDEDGNAHFIIGRVSRALRQAGHSEAASEFASTAIRSESYDALLQLAMRTVNVH